MMYTSLVLRLPHPIAKGKSGLCLIFLEQEMICILGILLCPMKSLDLNFGK